jgi:hypothetical protein
MKSGLQNRKQWFIMALVETVIKVVDAMIARWAKGMADGVGRSKHSERQGEQQPRQGGRFGTTDAFESISLGTIFF